MKTITNIKSTNRPEELDDHSSETIIFVRRNIKEVVEKDPVFNTEIVSYTYDEDQYSTKEWFNKRIDELQKQYDQLSNQVFNI